MLIGQIVRFFQHTFLFLLMLALAVLLSGWGYTGHFKINSNAALSYSADMVQFYQWTVMLAEQASDADIRKEWDPTEGPKHYIDIDNYPEFLATGAIPQAMDSVIALHGYNFVYDQGILPWATKTTFDSLQSSFERRDWEKAVLFAADLGHYVADGHMPLHITRNYNGQYSGNNGIHSRYESEMVNMFISQINYDGYQIDSIADVSQYIFNYLYSNYTYIDSLLEADDYAQNIAGNTYSTQYYTTLWDRTENMTVTLFKRASHALAELMLTAWLNSGGPMIAAVYSPSIYNTGLHIQNSPNPFIQKTKISFSLPGSSQVVLEIRDHSGQLVITLLDEIKPAGSYQLDWNARGESDGVYYAVIYSQHNIRVCKMILTQ